MKDIYEYRLNIFINDEEYKEYRRRIVLNMGKLTEEELLVWNKYERERTNQFHEIYEKWHNTKKEYTNFGISVDGSYGYLYSYLGSCGIRIDTEVVHDCDKFNTDDIVASDYFLLYDEQDGEKTLVDGSHYIYVTDVLQNGKIIVSSWGGKYSFDNSTANWTDKILLKESN